MNAHVFLARTTFDRILDLLSGLMEGDPVAIAIVVAVIAIGIGVTVWKRKKSKDGSPKS